MTNVLRTELVLGFVVMYYAANALFANRSPLMTAINLIMAVLNLAIMPFVIINEHGSMMAYGIGLVWLANVILLTIAVYRRHQQQLAELRLP